MDVTEWIKKNVSADLLAHLKAGTIRPSDFWDALRDLTPKEHDYYAIVFAMLQHPSLIHCIEAFIISPSPIDVNRKIGDKGLTFTHRLVHLLNRQFIFTSTFFFTFLINILLIIFIPGGHNPVLTALLCVVEFWNAQIDGPGVRDVDGRSPLDYVEKPNHKELIKAAREKAVLARAGIHNPPHDTNPRGPENPRKPPDSYPDLSSNSKKDKEPPTDEITLKELDRDSLPPNTVKVRVADVMRDVGPALKALGDAGKDSGKDGQVVGRIKSPGNNVLELGVRGKAWDLKSDCDFSVQMERLADVADSVAELHGQRKVQADFSPKMLLTSSDGEGVLACLFPKDAGTDASFWAFLPKSAESVSYRKAQGPVTPQSDTEFFLLLVWYVVTKKAPFEETGLNIQTLLNEKKWPDTSTLRPDLKAIFDKVWASKHPIGMQEVEAALRKLA
jgi:hypothetical protein